MKKSTHRVEVIQLNPFKHPKADALSIQQVYGYTVVLRTEDWAGITHGAYIVPDSVVDTERPEFSWLKAPVYNEQKELVSGNPNFRAAVEDSDRYHRVTAMRLRGVISYGLMVPAPEGAVEGDDVSDFFGITRYNPTFVSPDAIEGPSRFTKDYDLEAFERYAEDIFKPGEDVVYVEKLDGENLRFCFQDGRLHAGSKNQWIDPLKGVDATPWRAARKFPALENFVREHPDCTLYGEGIGYPKSNKTSRRYNIQPGELDFYAFDILRNDQFLDYDDIKELCAPFGIKVAPEIARVQYDPATIRNYLGKKTLVGGVSHKAEGLICRPLKERRELSGRAILKLVDWS